MLSRLYSDIQVVQLDEHIFEQAKKFAADVASTTDYRDSNQTTKAKIQEDHYISKLGEEAAKRVLSSFAKVSGPDYSIYQGKNKSWKDDLYIGNDGLAVKTQKRSAANRYGLSWVFQCGPTRKDIILNRPDAWVIFVEYNDLGANSFRVFPMFQVKELVFKDPVLAHLRGHKRVVYANTLKW